MNIVDYLYYLLVAAWSLVFGQKTNLTVPSSISDNIFIYYFLGPTIDDYIVLNLDNGLSLSKQPKFDSSKPTHFFYHGWGENATIGSSAVVNQALLDANICNVVAFDYSNLTNSKVLTNYIISVYNASYIGQAIGEFFLQYVNYSQPVELIRMTSHSLGAQIMAKAARTYGVGKLPRLTGLDPAGPLYNIIGVKHLVASDAKFVDIIHSDGGFFGDGRTIGTADFFPNKGTRVQPGCHDNLLFNPFSFCSHRRSYQYYAESILNPQNFLGKTCNRTVLFNYCCCKNNSVATMGYYVDTKINGTYYLVTNSTSPFGLGIKGLNFK